VIESFPEIVCGVCGRAISDGGNYLVTGSNDGAVLMWKIIEDENQCRAKLYWSSSAGALAVTGASIQGARGLTQVNKQLLKQRGAVGEPEHLLREASKRVLAMASVASRMK
jgi:prophage tail gpP-like protein